MLLKRKAEVTWDAQGASLQEVAYGVLEICTGVGTGKEIVCKGLEAGL